MNIKYIIQCPYCGTEQRRCIDITSQYGDTALIEQCDTEEGGCDRQFAVSYSIETNYSAYRIEGINDEMEQPA